MLFQNKIILFAIFFCIHFFASAQSDSIQNKKLNKVLYISGASYVGLYSGLGLAWYAKQPLSHFRFFNDNDEWLLTDKMGHAHTAFMFSSTGIDVLSELGMKRKKAIYYGSLAGIIFQTPIELMDGFVSTYGASWGDELANISGAGFSLAQYLLWDEIRITPKFSYIKTDFPNKYPQNALLGSSPLDYWLKDYNGQVYWLSISPAQFLSTNSKFPKFLALAIGTGATNMARAQYHQNIAIGLQPYRSYYLSLDVDLRAIKTKKVWLKQLFKSLNYIRIPLPALSYSRQEKIGFVIH